MSICPDNDKRLLGEIVSVLLPIPSEGPYSYSLPDGMARPPVGTFVQVSLGSRKLAAVVWEMKKKNKIVNPKKFRPIESVFDCPPVSDELRRFVDWIASYTISSPGIVLRMVLRVPAALDPESLIKGLRYSGKQPKRMTHARQRVLKLMNEQKNMSWTRSDLAHASGVSPSVVKGMEKLGIFEPVFMPPPAVVPLPNPETVTVAMSQEQIKVTKQFCQTIQSGRFVTTLLKGVTGSGKTEVYFEAIAEALRQGKQILILLPEIALTSIFLERFQKRFGAPPAQWHSGLTLKMREQTWRQVSTEQIRVLVGARSALFLPFQNLGLIIVDEEHDGAYKQEERLFYSARDMAVVRAFLGNGTCILSSATPSIESQVNVEMGRYQCVKLKKRHGDAVLPVIDIIDMRKDPPKRGDFLSPILTQAVGKALVRGEQSLLFLNRRGYAPLTLCRVCGFRFECKNCSAWLVEHRFCNQLQCHHCGYKEAVTKDCPNCGRLDSLVACGPGVERLAEEIKTSFPNARIIILSSDTTANLSCLRLDLETIVKGQVDIVIGTQLLAKGHNFPLITCVGVVDSDIGLSNGDPRAAEKTFQLISQVTKKAGRKGTKSIGLLQSYAPDNPVLRAIANGDEDIFYEREIALRRQAFLPPFSRLISLIISARDKKEAEIHACKLKLAAPHHENVKILGPAEALMALVRGRYRYRLLLQAPRSFDFQNYLKVWLAYTSTQQGSVRVQIDVDPQTFS
ncbi:primosomal protein N' [Candidatus Endowatersipora endosymbiont of Watersipora subatra]|uniref:primosomal protein N' n=1 Tax=Candidatus Endowatersipora endosymbiont of Watersipora subatra TaxID=3077946 RepID=UPI00312C93FB